MEFDVGYIIATVDFVIALIILGLTIITAKRLKGSIMFWASVFFLFTAIMYVIHAGVEIFIGLEQLGGDLYAITALIATILLGFTVVIIDITTRVLAVKR